jgi:hypothetical protein
LPPSAFCTKSPENELAFANHPLTKRARRRPGDIEPLHILNIAAAITDEVVMPHASGIKSRSAALDRYFPYQTGIHQITQIVVSRGPGRTWIDAIHSFENFRSRGVPVAIHQE